MNCKDCHYWGNSIGFSHRHYCNNDEKLHEDYNGPGEDDLTYEYTEGGWFITGPMFGCVHFKDKAK